MTEETAIKIVVLHLTRVVHEWWHHGIITEGHQKMKCYDEFTQKLIKRYDRTDPQWDFKQLIPT